MIEAKATQHPTFLSLEIIYPDSNKHEFKKITGGDAQQRASHAMKLIHFKSRDYILDKMTKWIKMRMYSFDLSAQSQRKMQGSKLLVILSYNQDRGFYRVCQVISDNEQLIRDLAPSERSKHFNYYNNMIIAIVNYCKLMI